MSRVRVDILVAPDRIHVGTLTIEVVIDEEAVPSPEVHNELGWLAAAAIQQLATTYSDSRRGVILRKRETP